MAREAGEGPSALPSTGLIRQFCHSPDRCWFASRLWKSTPQENSRTFIPTAAAGECRLSFRNLMKSCALML